MNDMMVGQRLRLSRGVREQVRRAQAQRAREGDRTIEFIERMGYEVADWQRDWLRDIYATQPNEAKRARVAALFGQQQPA